MTRSEAIRVYRETQAEYNVRRRNADDPLMVHQVAKAYVEAGRTLRLINRRQRLNDVCNAMKRP